MADNVMKLGLILSATDKMSRVIDQAVGKSVAKLNDFQKKADKIGKGMQKVGAGMAAAGTAITGALFADVASVAEKAKQIQFSAQKIGLSTDEFQKLSFAAKKSGMEISQFEVGMGKLAKTMVSASIGQKASVKIMKMAGISAQDSNGQLKGSSQILKEISDKFAKAPDGPKKTALAMMLFGKSGKDMIPLLNKGGASIDALGKKFEKSGALINKDGIEAFKKYRGVVADSKLALEGMKTTVAIAVLPTITKLMQKIANVTEKIGGWIQHHKKLFTATVSVVGVIGMLLTGMGTFLLVTGTVIRTIARFAQIMKLVQGSMLLFKVQYYALVAAEKIMAFWTAITTSSVWAFTAALLANPITWIVVGIAALVAGIIYAWKHFAKFRAVVLTVWDTIKGFGGILKEYVIDRIKGIISGLGSMGRAISLLFKGKFSAAFDEAKKGVRALSGYDAKIKAVGRTKELVTNISGKYTATLAKEREKEADKPKSTTMMANNTSAVTNNAISASPTSSQINYNPTINIGSGSAADKESFRQMLNSHKRELEQAMKEIQNKNKRVSYNPNPF